MADVHDQPFATVSRGLQAFLQIGSIAESPRIMCQKLQGATVMRETVLPS
jgi:hypothetical protein